MIEYPCITLYFQSFLFVIRTLLSPFLVQLLRQFSLNPNSNFPKLVVSKLIFRECEWACMLAYTTYINVISSHCFAHFPQAQIGLDCIPFFDVKLIALNLPFSRRPSANLQKDIGKDVWLQVQMLAVSGYIPAAASSLFVGRSQYPNRGYKHSQISFLQSCHSHS
jgi:hypothetical protein